MMGSSTTTTIDQELGAGMRELEAEAILAHEAAVVSHRRLKDAVKKVNASRLEHFGSLLKDAGMGYCRQCSSYRWLEDLRLALPHDRWQGAYGTVRALCPGCWERNRRRNWLRPVHEIDGRLEYLVTEDIWAPVPNGERMGEHLCRPVHRISVSVAERFGAYPTIHFDYRSAPPSVAPKLGLYEGRQLVTI